MKLRAAAAAFALACALTTACDLLTKKSPSSSPTSPTGPATSLDAFAGTWASITPSTPPTGCGNVKYTVTPTAASSANVTFAGTCAGNITVTGSGSGTLSGSTINWSASGLVGQGGVNCPFTFTNSKATLDAAGQVVVAYTGAVCGIPVSGTETVKK
ncbi:MAG TPA: hypothetical protein VF921_04230 [Vicinamibacterales bacterium]